jgi:cobalt/nickel transport protein
MSETKTEKTEKFSRKWLAALLFLAIISPIGILVVWDYGDAWGEWGEVGEWVPQQFWTAPMPDYNFEGWEGQLMSSLGYIVSALVGVIVVILLTYVLMRLFARKNDDETGN